MKLDSIVPWGRSYSEYCAMFRLGPGELAKHLLGCGDGPAAFNAVATAAGSRVISVDPVYAFGADDIRARIEEVRPDIESGLKENASDYVWDHFQNVETLVEARLDAMRTFLEDYPAGKASGRYLAAGLPTLPFGDNHFDLVLVSHLLFTYSDHMDVEMHRKSVLELMRVSDEIRIFPLLDMSAKPSPFVDDIRRLACDQGWAADIECVDYEFQRGGNEMLKLTRR